jgi:hypothetical protein
MKKSLIGLLVFNFVLAEISSACAATTDSYSEFKNMLNDKYGLNYELDYSVLGQRSSPSGKYNAVQSYFAPSVVWTNFDNQYGTGALNFSYNSVYYGRHNALDLQNRSGMVTPINDYDDEAQEFAGLYYTYQLPDKYNWLTLGLGQYPIYNFDGTSYDANQQINFINYALSQNATSSYSTAGVGFYMQANPEKWSFVVGAQDASNVSATGIKVNKLHDKHYTTFGSIGYNPSFKYIGSGEYSVMVYNQPAVSEQPQSTTGWSVNMAQNLGKKLSLFGRINGVTGNIITIKQSYVAGLVYNNPLDRNALDQIGLAYAYNRLDAKAVGENIYHKAEQVIEAYWAWGISKWATVTPDFEFYINPALNQKSDYGTTTSLRLTVLF